MAVPRVKKLTVVSICIAILVIRQYATIKDLRTDLSTFQAAPSPPRRYGNPHLTEIPDHPHAGAKDEFGYFGYVHDPAILRNPSSASSNYASFIIPPEELSDLCAPLGEGPEAAGYESSLARGVFEKIEVADESSFLASFSPVKVFCAVYTHPGSNNQTNAIRQTWGRRCDGFMAASTETNHDAATVHLPHDGNNEGKYNGIWQKVRSILAYINDNFIDEYDFFFLCGDDTYLIVENLKAMLMNPKVLGTTFFAGGAWTHPHPVMMTWYNATQESVYLGGGAGYVLGRQTVKSLVEHVLPICYNKSDVPVEDFMVSFCLQTYLNVSFFDTRDEKEADRFIQYDPVDRAQPFLIQKSPYAQNQGKRLKKNYNWTAIDGLDSVSSSAISFHMVKPAVKMRRYERILYRRKYKELDQQDCRLHYMNSNYSL